MRIGAKTPLDNHKNGMEQALLSCRCRLAAASWISDQQQHPSDMATFVLLAWL